MVILSNALMILEFQTPNIGKFLYNNYTKYKSKVIQDLIIINTNFESKENYIKNGKLVKNKHICSIEESKDKTFNTKQIKMINHAPINYFQTDSHFGYYTNNQKTHSLIIADQTNTIHKKYDLLIHNINNKINDDIPFDDCAMIKNILINGTVIHKIDLIKRLITKKNNQLALYIAKWLYPLKYWKTIKTLQKYNAMLTQQNEKIRNCKNAKCQQRAKKICVGCFNEYYCSRACQKKSWIKRHRNECENEFGDIYQIIKTN